DRPLASWRGHMFDRPCPGSPKATRFASRHVFHPRLGCVLYLGFLGAESCPLRLAVSFIVSHCIGFGLYRSNGELGNMGNPGLYGTGLSLVHQYCSWLVFLLVREWV